jgi:hypothetical protein
MEGGTGDALSFTHTLTPGRAFPSPRAVDTWECRFRPAGYHVDSGAPRQSAGCRRDHISFDPSLTCTNPRSTPRSSAEAVWAVPNDASSPLLNAVGGAIVLVLRGGVTFASKVRHAQAVRVWCQGARREVGRPLLIPSHPPRTALTPPPPPPPQFSLVTSSVTGRRRCRRHHRRRELRRGLQLWGMARKPRRLLPLVAGGGGACDGREGRPGA